MIYKNIIYRIISNHVGTPLLVIDTASGKIAAESIYGVFGERVLDSNPDLIPFGFAGGLEDNDTGLIRFGARDYDPEVGRWTSKDPILFNGGLTNLFGYANNDPVNFIDPSGTIWGTVIGAVIGSITGYITTGTLEGALIGAGSGALTGTTLGSGIIAGTVIGAAADVATQLASGASISNLDYTSIVLSAVSGGLGAAAGIGASNALQIPFNVIGQPVGTSVLNQLSSDIISSAVGGIASGLVSVVGTVAMSENSCPAN